jgi:hypothetical protein
VTSEPVGTVAEEAAKLFAAMSDWATTHQAGHVDTAGHDQPPSEPAAECRFCPLCQLMHQIRSTSPEIRDLMTSAATSLALAAKNLLDNVDSATRGRDSGVEKINLTEDSWD